MASLKHWGLLDPNMKEVMCSALLSCNMKKFMCSELTDVDIGGLGNVMYTTHLIEMA
jgi:hypothetical protein